MQWEQHRSICEEITYYANQTRDMIMRGKKKKKKKLQSEKYLDGIH